MFDICIGIIVFNLALTFVKTISIFSGYMSLPGGVDVTPSSTYYSPDSSGLEILSLLWGSLQGSATLTIIGGVVGGAASLWSGNYSLLGISIFAGLFWGSLFDGLQPIMTIIYGAMPTASAVAFSALIIIPLVYIFISSILQMTTGGWMSYK